jgi:superfamily I DNA/RNA helicase
VLWLGDLAQPGARDQVAAAAEPIVLSTLHSAKGLEFPTVVLAGLSWGEADQGKRMAAYVGMTRATRRLHVVVQESDALAEAARQAAETAAG